MNGISSMHRCRLLLLALLLVSALIAGCGNGNRGDDVVLVFSTASDMQGLVGEEYFGGACSALKAFDTDFMISPGDLNPNGDENDPDWVLDAVRAHLGPNYLWYPVVGNHDQEEASALEWYRGYNPVGSHRLPGIVSWGPDGCEETTYSFEYANVHFSVLNEYYDGSSDRGLPGGEVVEELYDWLESDLAGNTKPVVFVVGHEPAYPQPDADAPDFWRHVGQSLDRDPQNRDRFWSLLRSYGVLAYVCGHTHGYSTVNIDGVWQVDGGHARGVEYPDDPPSTGVAPSTALVFTVYNGGKVDLQVLRRTPLDGPYTVRHKVTLSGGS